MYREKSRYINGFIAISTSVIFAFPSIGRCQGNGSSVYSKQAVYTFLKTVACLALPDGSCDALNADTARDLLIARRTMLLTKFCGPGNGNEAVKLLNVDGAIDAAPDPVACKELTEIIKNTEGVKLHAN